MNNINNKIKILSVEYKIPISELKTYNIKKIIKMHKKMCNKVMQKYKNENKGQLTQKGLV